MTALLTLNTTLSPLSSSTFQPPMSVPLMPPLPLYQPIEDGRSALHLHERRFDSTDDFHHRRKHAKKNHRRKRVTHQIVHDLEDSHSTARDQQSRSKGIHLMSETSWWEEHQKRILNLEEDESKRKRSINSPAFGKPKNAQLYNTNTRSVLEVHRNGSISTTEKTDSPYSIFRVFSLCSIFAFASLQNCSDILKFTERLYFVESQRYLCIDSRRNIYTDTTGNNTECTLKHELLTNKYDIYYSHIYPGTLERCENIGRRSTDSHRKVTKSRNSLSLAHQSLKNAKSDLNSLNGKSRKGSRLRACSSRWYLGVGGDHDVKVFITGENRTKREMFFIQKWHSSKNMSFFNQGIVIDERKGVKVQTSTKQMPTHQDHTIENNHFSRYPHEFSPSFDFSPSSFDADTSLTRLTTTSDTVNDSLQTIPQKENTSSSSSSSSSISTSTSPLKRTRSSLLNSLKHKTIDCSNLLKVNCSSRNSRGEERNKRETVIPR